MPLIPRSTRQVSCRLLLNLATLPLLIQTAGAHAAEHPTIECIATPTSLDIVSGDRLLLRYNTAVVEPPEGMNPAYRRSGHIHPLNTPAGRTVTAEFPADHAHQHGLFFAWVNTKFKGRKVDFWNQADLTGTVRHVRVDGVSNRPTSAEFTVTLEHIALHGDEPAEPVLEETWTIIAAPPNAESFSFELISRQTCVADAPLLLKTYHYGGMALRGTSEWLQQPESNMLTSEGLTRIEGNHSRPDWATLHGLLDGQPCGVTVIAHPSNFRAPQPVRLHPEKPYFVFSPTVLGEHKIFPGESLISRYLVVTHDGPVQPARNDTLHRALSSD